MKILNINTLNKIYNRHKNLKDNDFINALIEEFEIRFEIPEEDLKRVPKTGAFITISNHPLGGVDGILLLKLILEQRPDFKIIANFLLRRIEPLKPFVLLVNPFEDRKNVKSGLMGFKTALEHVRQGFPLGLFPAGEVSTHREGKSWVDRPLEPAAIKLIKKANVPVLSIYFHGKNSKMFYRLAKLNSTLRTAKSPTM